MAEDVHVLDEQELMTKITESKEKQVSLAGAQRLSYEIARVITATPVANHKDVEDHRFSTLCKLSDLFNQVIPGFDEDRFFKTAGYSKSWTRK